MKPCAAWDGYTPVPLQQLYSSILHGRLDLRLPLANAQAPDRAMLLSRVVGMPVQQHLQLQVPVLVSASASASVLASVRAQTGGCYGQLLH